MTGGQALRTQRESPASPPRWPASASPPGCPAHQDDEPHELGVGAFPALAGNDVPLLGGADDDLGGADLLLTQLVVASQLRNSDAICGQALSEGKARQARMLGGGVGARFHSLCEV